MKQIIWFVKTYATFVVLFVLQKPLFLFLEKGSATHNLSTISSRSCLPLSGMDFHSIYRWLVTYL